MQHERAATGFRQDINGLRAWAVVAVILYHFNVWGARGGFIGVDVFFVISGFLMTGIIVERLEAGRFSILDFYLARARRIIPALSVLGAVLLTAGYFVLHAQDYKALATQLAYSLSFLSNIEYWKGTGYFDTASHEKWLLHTWSLSVEWQFYLLLPLVLAAAWKFFPGRGMLLGVVAAGMGISLGLCVEATASAASAAFFLLPYRAWEMLGGGLVFLIGERLRMSGFARRALHYLGLLGILAANLVFDHRSAWPGAGAALPVAATMMVILSGQASAWVANPLAQWLGDRSYSLYLWHWPVYVALVYMEWHAEVSMLAAGLLLTLVLGHLSYSLVENCARKWLGKRPPFLAASSIAGLVLIVAGPAILVWRVQGVPGRLPASVDLIAQEATNVNPRQRGCHTSVGVEPLRCQYGAGHRKVIVLGDSHADAIVTGVSSVLETLDIQVEQMSYSACPFVTGMRVSYPFLAKRNAAYQCVEYVKRLAHELESRHASVPVILVNRYAAAAFGFNEEPQLGTGPNVLFAKDYAEPRQEYLEEFSQAIVATACSLAKTRTVYLMRPIPEMGRSIPKALARRVSLGIDGEMSISLAEYRQRNEWVWKAQDAARERCNVKILDPTSYLCSDGRCYGSKNGRPLYYDDDHLSEYGNKLLAPMYLEMFRQARF